MNKYNAFKNFLEVEEVGEKNTNEAENAQQMDDSRSFYVFADVFHQTVHDQVKQRLREGEDREFILMSSCLEWFRTHI